MNQERFKQLAERAGFNHDPNEEDAEAQLLLGKLERFYAATCEEAVQAAAAVFHGDLTRLTEADATARCTLAIRSLYTNDVLFSLADPHYDMGLLDHLPVTRLRP